MKELDSGYTVETDAMNEDSWSQLLQEFNDANIYQTWPYGEVHFGRDSLSHLVLKNDGRIIAAAQVVLKTIPVFRSGVAYIYWGPLWRKRDIASDHNVFRQMVRALRNEYAGKRGLAIRILPVLYNDDQPEIAAAPMQEEFKSLHYIRRQKTLIVDLTASLESLRGGLNQKWRNCLNRAERNDLELLEGSDDDLFAMFIEIYKEMHDRKKFVETSDIAEFRLIQKLLQPGSKMRIIICRKDGKPVAGSIFSALGTTGVYLYGATSNEGMSSNGSYLIQWRAMEWMKEENCISYDLHGIDPIANPGTYKFKAGLCGKNGREVEFLGQFESCVNPLSSLTIKCGETLMNGRKKTRELIGNARL